MSVVLNWYRFEYSLKYCYRYSWGLDVSTFQFDISTWRCPQLVVPPASGCEGDEWSFTSFTYLLSEPLLRSAKVTVSPPTESAGSPPWCPGPWTCPGGLSSLPQGTDDFSFFFPQYFNLPLDSSHCRTSRFDVLHRKVNVGGDARYDLWKGLITRGFYWVSMPWRRHWTSWMMLFREVFLWRRFIVLSLCCSLLFYVTEHVLQHDVNDWNSSYWNCNVRYFMIYVQYRK